VIGRRRRERHQDARLTPCTQLATVIARRAR
jgi:hypothetical protein